MKKVGRRQESRRCADVVTAALLVCTIVALGAGAASGSTFVAMGLRELVAESDTVVLGRVAEVRSFWDKDRRAILSEALIEVEESLVGESDQKLRVRTFGGTVDDYQIVAHGFPEFAEGNRVVLFVKRHEDESLRVTGYQLGHYRIVERSGVDFAVPTVDSGSTLVSADGRSIAGPESRELAAFREQLTAIADDVSGASSN